MKEPDDQLERALRELPEIPFAESLRWDILEAVHDLQARPIAEKSLKRTRSRRRLKPFAATFAGVAVAALVIVGVLQSGVVHGKPKLITASIPASEVGLKPANVEVFNPTYSILPGTSGPTVFATVKNTSGHPINKYNTFAVLWLGGTNSDPLSGESLTIANGPGTPLPGRPSTDDNGPLNPGQTTKWQFNLDFANSQQYVKDGIHLLFFKAGVSDANLQPPYMIWHKAPLRSQYIGSEPVKVVPGTSQYQGYERVQYSYKIVNTGSKTVDLSQVWGIDWFDNPGQTGQKWDDPKVTRYADIPHLVGSQNPLIRPGQSRVVYFTWTIPDSISGILSETPQVFFVTRKTAN